MRLIAYHVADIFTYRRRIQLRIDPRTKKLKVKQVGPWEAVCKTGPHYFKNKSEAGPYCKQIAFANHKAGHPYDWSCGVQWRGIETRPLMETISAPLNGHECPRCGKMTTQGGAKDVCESCSKVRN